MTYSTAYNNESSFGAPVSDLGETDRSATKVVMPDIYADSKPATKPDPRVADQSSPDTDSSMGFNPYDTGVLQQNKIES
jgi:hypothetical protein